MKNIFSKHRKTICLDFDGVIHKHISAWKDRSDIPDKPVYGSREAIIELKRKYKVVVHSGRCCEEAGRKAIETWLKKYDIEVDEVCTNKPIADYYVDDKAIQFRGDWMQTAKDIRGFRHWQSFTKAMNRGSK